MIGGHPIPLVVADNADSFAVDKQEVGAVDGGAPLSCRTWSTRLWQLGYRAARRCRIGFHNCVQRVRLAGVEGKQIKLASIGNEGVRPLSK